MTIEQINLYKLIQLMYLPEKKKISELKIIQRSLAAEDSDGGGDFYSPFWADIKTHLRGEGSISTLTTQRITKSKRRERLYSLYLKGFLSWEKNLLRQSNMPWHLQQRTVHANFDITGQGVIKANNAIELRSGTLVKIVYAYFCEKPSLTQESIRVMLWALSRVLKEHPTAALEVFDIIRGVGYNIANTILVGDEEKIFRQRYEELRKLSKTI